MRTAVMTLAAGLMLVAAPAAAQHAYGHYNQGQGYHGYGQDRSGWNVAAQYDRPGDYRCDAFWDANRDDCGAAWRDQRHRTSYGYRNDGYGRSYGYNTRRRGYGYAQGESVRGGSTYYGAYGRPDLVYPGGGYSYGGHGAYSGGRDASRIDWCRATYRSYDPASGYYRAYSGRLIYCG